MDSDTGSDRLAPSVSEDAGLGTSQLEEPRWNSDLVADAVRAADVDYIALNPGASYRGFHDSLVNYLGDKQPAMLLCLHEEHAVAIAHGYAKVTERPMAVMLHSNVGVMHATMGIFDAFCDMVPVLLLAADGPMDARARRPWIDWIHTNSDVGALVRPYVKWDDRPASVGAAIDAIGRAAQLTRTHPEAPTFVCLDSALLEQPNHSHVSRPSKRPRPIPDAHPNANDVALAAERLRSAERPVILMGRVGRGSNSWQQRLCLAESLDARVITDRRVGASFPTDHPLHAGQPGSFLHPEARAVLSEADVVLSLDWDDVTGTLNQAPERADRLLIDATARFHLFNGWMKNDYAPVSADICLHGRADIAVAELVRELNALGMAGTRAADHPQGPASRPPVSASREESSPERISLNMLTTHLRKATASMETTLVRVPTGWDASGWPLRGPLDYLGSDGGGGTGSGPGQAVGAALALKDSDRLVIAVLGDGDYLMGCTALWTAARYDLPLLVVVANNRSYFNDELHQHRVAKTRSRPAERAHIGMRIEDPPPDLAGIARGLGVEGIGPVTDVAELGPACHRAVTRVTEGVPVVLDVVVERDFAQLRRPQIPGASRGS